MFGFRSVNGPVSQSATGNQKLDASQSVTSAFFANQFGSNEVTNNYEGGTGITTQNILKNQQGDQHQIVTNASTTFVTTVWL